MLNPDRIFWKEIELREILPDTINESAEILMELYNSSPKALSNFAMFQKHVTLKDEIEYLRDKVRNTTDRIWLVFSHHEEGCIGTIGLHEIDVQSRVGRLGIAIWNDQFTGHGFGTDAAYAILQHAFEQLMFEKVYVKFLVENTAALRFNSKLGFLPEGRLVKEYRSHGQMQDMFRMCMFPETWEAHKATLANKS